MCTLGTFGNKKKHKISEKFSLCKGQKCIDKQPIWITKSYMKSFLEDIIYQIIATFPYVPHVHISAQKWKKFIPDCLWHPTSKIFTYKIN